jgi:hypothetical protein
MSAAAIRNQYSDLYGSSMLPVLESIFASEVARHPSARDQIARKTTTDRDIWQGTEIHDLPLFAETPENTSVTYSRTKQGASKTLTMTKYARGFSISQEAVEDGKFNMIADMTKKLAKSGMESKEIQFMDLFNNGFGTETTADGLPIFDLAHTLPSGDTFRNELASAADLSQTSLSTALLDFEKVFVGDSGIFMKIRPRALVVPTELKHTAEELVKSTLKPGGATNDINVFEDEGLRVITSPHLTDDDAWFLTSAPEDHYMWCVERQGLRTQAASPDVGFHTDSLFYKASYREKVGATTPYGVFGSPGA